MTDLKQINWGGEAVRRDITPTKNEYDFLLGWMSKVKGRKEYIYFVSFYNK